MQTRWSTRGLTALLLGLAGCQTPETNLKPPLQEEYRLPPTEDARFSQPVKYPRETLNNFPIKKDTSGGNNGPPGSGGAGRPGGMSMGGTGGGGRGY